jgi:hypothetical protein
MTDFEQLASRAAKILASDGYLRRKTLPGWSWESKLNRVRFNESPETGPHYPYIVVRQKFETNAQGDRVLLPQAHTLPIEPNPTPERVATIVKGALEEPY